MQLQQLILEKFSFWYVIQNNLFKFVLLIGSCGHAVPGRVAASETSSSTQNVNDDENKDKPLKKRPAMKRPSADSEHQPLGGTSDRDEDEDDESNGFGKSQHDEGDEDTEKPKKKPATAAKGKPTKRGRQKEALINSLFFNNNLYTVYKLLFNKNLYTHVYEKICSSIVRRLIHLRMKRRPMVWPMVVMLLPLTCCCLAFYLPHPFVKTSTLYIRKCKLQ